VRRSVAFVMRTSRAGSTSFIEEVRRTIWAVNPDLPLASVQTMDSLYTNRWARTSFTLVLLAIAGRDGAAHRP